MSEPKVEIRHKTEHGLDKDLDKLMFLAAEEKLLPKIIYQYSVKNGHKRFVNEYQKSVKQIYTKETLKPLEYNEREAKTHREMFREQIVKLMNNELPIEYLKPVKVQGKYVMTYRDEPLEKVQYPTKCIEFFIKAEFTIFNDFSERKFNKSYEDIFEDKLEYQHQKLFGSGRESVRKKTKSFIDYSEKSLLTLPSTQKNVEEPLQKEVQSYLSLPKLTARVTPVEKNKISIPLNTKKKIMRVKTMNEEEEILQTMRKIGGYSMNSVDISITKESILKYFREFYQRPHRIVDFLEFPNVVNFTSFSKIPQKLKLMPNDHIYFMAFLFYDSNNDGYICANDIIRMEEISKKCPIINEDCQILKMGAHKIKYENEINYKDLYRLSEITETTYFNWSKKEKEVEDVLNPELEEELKSYFRHINKKKILIHFEGFKKLFMGQKPYLWYDVLDKVSGIKYEGLKY